jgi:HAD superfamily phosphoserine phosphatase-like hydrolase
MDLVVLSDFDGTIVDVEMPDLILSKFAEGDWRVFDDQLARGEITLEECVRRQLSTVRADRSLIIRGLDKSVSFRPGFGDLVVYCASNAISLVVVSGGLGFIIKPFLGSKG